MTGRWRLALAAVAVGMLAALTVSVGVNAQGQAASLQLASQNNSGVAGTATITDIGGGKLRVEIAATGAGAGPQPAHIHEGTCSQLNPAPKFALTDVRNGASSTTVDGSLGALTAAPHAIHMHKSPDELPVYLACADIRASAPAGAAPTGQPQMLPASGVAGVDASSIAVLSGAGFGLISLGIALARRRARRG
jgi:Cu/Zn superoxide dismutase